jgi:hypothetical protein
MFLPKPTIETTAATKIGKVRTEFVPTNSLLRPSLQTKKFKSKFGKLWKNFKGSRPNPKGPSTAETKEINTDKKRKRNRPNRKLVARFLK